MVPNSTTRPSPLQIPGALALAAIVVGGTARTFAQDLTWTGPGAACVSQLEARLAAEGYTSQVVLDASGREPSVVDAANEIRDRQHLDVVVLLAGSHAHVVAPFLSYPQARSLVWRSGSSTHPARLCRLAEMVADASTERRGLRRVLAAICLAAAGLFGAIRPRAPGRAASPIASAPTS